MSDIRISEIIQVIRAQSHVFRYSRLLVHRKQSDAEHVGRACQLALLFVSDLQVRYAAHNAGMNHTKGVEYWRVISREVLLGIIKHDMGESKFGDVTWDIKQLFPQIETAEANYLHELWGNLLITESYHTGVGVLIDAADCAEGILFCLDEMDLGNTALHLVLTSYKRRLEAAKESLEGLFGVSPLSIDYLLMEAQSRL